MSVPVNLEIFMTDLTRAGLASVSKSVDDAEGQTRQLIAALERVREEYQRFLEAHRRAGQSYAQEQATVQALTGQINGLKEGLKELETAKQQANATPLVDADAISRKTGNLRMQFQQVARELPSLAMGPQMFILAVSNNLPMLADAIADVRKQNELLKASGRKSVSVWKQLGSALLSWQTALVAGISLLIVFGDEIVEWVGNLFKAKEQLDLGKESVKAFNEAMLEGGKSAQREVTNLSILYRATQDVTRGMNERLAAVAKLQEQYPSFFGNMSQEDILAGKAADSYTRLASSIVASARAQAARSKIVEQQSSVLENEQKINEAYIRLSEAEDKLRKVQEFYRKQQEEGFGTATAKLSAENAVIRAENNVKDIEREIAGYRTAIYTANKLSADLERGINIEDLLFEPDKGNSSENKGKEKVEALKSYLDELIHLRADNEDRQVDLMADGTEKELAEIDLRYKRIRDKVREQETNLTKEQGGKLTPEQLALFGEAYNQIDRQQARDREGVGVDDGTDTAKWLEAEREAMKRYTQDYGTFQDRIDAIKNEYTQKIAEAGGADTWQGKLLQKQMEEALSAIDMEKLKESINWELVFSDLGNASKESLEKVKRQLAEFKQSKEYQGMAVDQKKVIDESLDKIQSAIIDKGGLLGDLPNQLEELRKAQDELTAAQNEYNEAMRNGTDEQKEAAQRKLNKAEQNVANAQNNTDKAARQTTDNLLTLADALTTLGSNSELTLTEIGQLAGGIANTFSEAGSKIGGIIGAILTLLDQIGQEGLFGFLDNVLSSVGNAVYGVFDSLLGWTGIDFGGESDEHLAEDIQRLTASNQELEDAISNLSDKMDDAAVADAGDIYQQQLENLKKQEANTLEMMLRSAAAYSNGFLGMGGTHSSAHKINEGMSVSDWQAISEVVGRTIDDASDFFNLTSEEMWRVAQEATTEYAKLKDLADNGYKDAAQFMDEYIGYWQEMEELQDAYNEKLTSTSFDSIKDEFRNALLDMEDSTEAFADNFEKMMQNAILESMMTGTYDKALKDWYEDFAAHMAIGDMDTDTQEELRKQWQDIVDSASQQWNAWRDMMGWETDSTSTGSSQAPQSGALTTMSQDSISTFEGIGRSLQTHLISLDKVTQELRDQNRADSESLLQIVNNTSYLLPIYELMEKMDRDGIKIQ